MVCACAAQPAQSTVHILADHVTLSISHPEKLISCCSQGLPIESLLSGKHAWTRLTPESRSFAVIGPTHESVLFDLILSRRCFKVAYFSLRAA